MGICPQCGTNKASPNRVRCEECLAKNAETKRRGRRSSNNGHKTYIKRLRKQRKEEGKCIWCGKPICSSSTVFCVDCRIKNQRNNEARKSGIARNERKSYGLCYTCGGKLDRDGGICIKCAEKVTRNLPQKTDKISWRQSNKLIFKN